jgi:hypothetical protein
MLEAKKLQLETEGVTVRDSEFNWGAGPFSTRRLATATRKVMTVEAPRRRERSLQMMGVAKVGWCMFRRHVSRSDQAMYLGFRGFHSTGEYFPNLEPHFHRSNCACKFQPARAVHKFRLFLALPGAWL